MEIDGKTLIGWGFAPGKWFSDAIRDANALAKTGMAESAIREHLAERQPVAPQEIPLRTNSIPFGLFLEPETDDEAENLAGVIRHMDALLRTPTIAAGAVMPDACPSGSAEGTIPVGGVVATRDAIHPGFHSADICCSMAISVFKRREDATKVLDAAMKASHFGVGKRSKSEVRRHDVLTNLLAGFEQNPFLKGLEDYAEGHFMTQGDGNHFFYVGELESTGETAIVTHHGSRGLGAQLYKRGKQVAERHTSIIAPRIPRHNAWIDANSTAGEDYWAALQVIRAWTKLNHFAIHHEVAKRIGNQISGQFWNEHNFVFRKSDGLFYHAKGATPSFAGFAGDDSGATLIPLNMSEPILITEHANKPEALGFSPHGAGRNLSRTAHTKRLAAEFGSDARGLSPRDINTVLQRETRLLDIRFYTGSPDVSELPSAYKNAAQVESQIRKHGLANIVDRVMPLGSIMAGEMNWNRKR